MDVAVAMRFADSRRINMAQPIVGRYFSGNVQDQAAVGVSLVGIGINAPVKLFQIFINRAFNINHNFAVRTHTVALVTIQNIGFGSSKVVGRNQNLFDNILNLFDCRKRFRKFMLQNLQNLSRQQPAFLVAEFSGGGAGFVDSIKNSGAVKRCQSAITLGDVFKGQSFCFNLGHIVLTL